MRIGVIDNYDSFVFNLVRYVRQIEGVTVEVFRNDAVDYTTLNECDGILLSPGPGIPSEAGDLMKVIAQYHASKPLLGVCLGHQAIAEFYGAKLTQLASPVHGKSSLISHNGSTLFNNLPETVPVGRYHSWNVEFTDETSELNSTAHLNSEVMAISHKILPIHGVQFHPESILTPDGRTMINNWINSIKN